MTCRGLRAVFAALVITVAAASQTEAACTISTTGVVFGSYNVFNTAAVSSTGTITYRCGLFEALFGTVTISLSAGQSGTFSERTMMSGPDALGYNLFLDASATSIWGNGTGGTQVYSRSRPPFNTYVNITVYGAVPAGQDVSAGSYSDTISATINF